MGHFYPSQHFLERRTGDHNLISLPTPGMYISLTPQSMDYHDELPKWTTHMALYKVKLEIRYRK